MRDKKTVVKRISDVIGVSTAHGVGLKRVLVGNTDTNTSITQIAYTNLSMGDVVEKHTHPTMDEHFIILAGICVIDNGIQKYRMYANTYMYMPAGVEHRIEVMEALTMITIGVAIE